MLTPGAGLPVVTFGVLAPLTMPRIMRRVFVPNLRWPGPPGPAGEHAWRIAGLPGLVGGLRSAIGRRPSIVDWPPDAPAHETLTRCLVLAALLHVLLIAVFGTVPGGTARPGQGVWGSINVTLRGGNERGTSRDASSPAAEAGPVGQAVESRFGGAVRSEAEAPRINDGPGAATLGQWSSVRSEQAREVSPSGEVRPPDAPPAAAAAAPEAAAPLLLPPTPRAPPLATAATTDAPPSVTTRTVAPEPGAAPGAQVPAPSLAERIAPRAAESRPSESSRAAPVPSSDSARLPQAPAAAAAVTDAAPAPTLRSLSLAGPSRPQAPALERLVPPRIDSPALPSVAETPQLPATRAVDPVAERTLQALPATSAASPTDAARIERLEAVPRAAGVPALPDVPALPAISAAAPAATAAAGPATASPGPAVPTRVSPSAAALPSGAANAPGATSAATPAAVGRPTAPGAQAGPRLGQDIPTAPSASASSPRLNLELPRRAAAEIAGQGSRGVLNLVPPPPERRSKLADEIAKTARPDCKDAYAGLGILAPLPLAADALRGKGCKW